MVNGVDCAREEPLDDRHQILTHLRTQETTIRVRRILAPTLLFLGEKHAKFGSPDAEKRPDFGTVAIEDSSTELRERTGKKTPKAGLRLVVRSVGGEDGCAPPAFALSAKHRLPQIARVRLPRVPGARTLLEPPPDESGSESRGELFYERFVRVTRSAPPTVVHVEQHHVSPHPSTIPSE